MRYFRFCLLTLLMLSAIPLIGQKKWSYELGFGASLNTGNVNNCNINTSASVNRNDSIIALDFHYKLLYSALISKNNIGHQWEESNFEINGGIKMDYLQYSMFSPFLACEMVSNKYKGYDFKASSVVGVKYRIYTKPSICDYSISAALVYDRTEFTDSTVLPSNNFRISIRPKIKQKLADNLSLYHCTLFQPSVLDLKDFHINSVTKLKTKITRILFLDLAFTYEYRSRVPSENYKKHDILSEISLRLKF